MKNEQTLRAALSEISLCSQNSMSSKEECEKIARAALAATAIPAAPEQHCRDYPNDMICGNCGHEFGNHAGLTCVVIPGMFEPQQAAPEQATDRVARDALMTLNNIVLIATGVYDDYATFPYRVLKPFTFGDVVEKFKVQWKPGPFDMIEADSDCIADWMIAEGYIENLPVYEIYLGSYGRIEISESDGAIEFKPEE